MPRLCYLCGIQDENIGHLLLHCPATEFMWWNSSWHIHLTTFQHLNTQEWFIQLFGKHKSFSVDELEMRKICNFFGVAMEQLWLARNIIWLGKKAMTWLEISKNINDRFMRYYTACNKRFGMWRKSPYQHWWKPFLNFILTPHLKMGVPSRSVYYVILVAFVFCTMGL